MDGENGFDDSRSGVIVADPAELQDDVTDEIASRLEGWFWEWLITSGSFFHDDNYFYHDYIREYRIV